jgi:tRNA threonylcarbamoyladenosine biosynthesis protein TsaE
MRIRLVDEDRQVVFGQCLGRVLQGRGRIYLEGELGAGKTTLTRGILRAYGYAGAVKSPTYTLVEPYELASGRLYHFDLYRLGDPEELEFIGGRDLFAEDALCVVEWPSRGRGWLPLPDVNVTLSLHGAGRLAVLEAHTAHGRAALDLLRQESALADLISAEERDTP